MKTIYLIDGSSFAYRAFYAIGQLSTRSGQPTNAVYGFIRILNKLINRYKPEYLAIAFDTGKPTFRHEQFEDYKAHRKPMPDELIGQMQWIRKVVGAYNIPLIEKEGFEADDVIATMAATAEKSGFSVYVVTGDKDMMQLVNDNIKILNPSKDEVIVYDDKKVLEKYGVGPSKITQLLALVGDTSDNIPGVQGVGEKTGSRLLQQYGCINEVLNNLDNISPRLKKSITDHREQIMENLDLVTIRKDVPMEIGPEECIFRQPNTGLLKDIFRELEFKVLLKELLENGPAGDGTEDIKETNINDLDQWSKIFKDLIKAPAVVITEDAFVYKEGADLKFIKITPEIINNAGEDIIKILQNADIKKYAYDIKTLLRTKGAKLKGIFFDIHLAESLLGGKIIGEDRLAVEIYKTVPELEKNLIKEGLFDLYHKIELPLIEILADMENRGIRLDVNLLRGFSAELEDELTRLTGKIYKLAGEQFNINSPKQLETILFEKMNLPAGRRTKTGYSTDVDVLEKLSKIHELPKYILDYRQLNKIKGTYVDPLPQMVDSASRLHTTFNQVGAATGRISSNSPNLQNIPIKSDLGKHIRRAFIPEKTDFVFMGIDYSQIELRILAHLTGDKNLIKAFQDDKDIHAQTAQEIFGISKIEDVTPEQRSQAKVVNFGIIYGMGAKSMAEGMGITIQQAQDFIDKYFKKYPGVAEYIQSELQQAKEHGYVVTMFGRKRRVPELLSSKPQIEALGKRIAVNTPIQGSAADIIKLAMIDIYRKIQEEKLEAHMLLQIHDELIFELPEESVNRAEKIFKHEMENVVQLKVPLKVDVKIGRSWADL